MVGDYHVPIEVLSQGLSRIGDANETEVEFVLHFRQIVRQTSTGVTPACALERHAGAI